MPQLILEYSANIIEKDNISTLLASINKLLSEQLPTEIRNCKSRALAYSSFCIGDGNPQNAFVHLNLKIKAGRSRELLNILGNQIIEILKKYFSNSISKLNLEITLEIDELQDSYFKFYSQIPITP